MNFTTEHFSKSLSYISYRQHAENQLIKMGNDPENKFKDYAISNLARIKYLEEQVDLNAHLIEVLNNLKTEWIFCGIYRGMVRRCLSKPNHLGKDRKGIFFKN